MVSSIRKALLEPQNLHRRIDFIWRSRVRHLIAGVEHVPLVANPKIFLHLIPLTETPFLIDRHKQEHQDTARNLKLFLGHHSPYHHINIDGFFGYDALQKSNSDISSYVQIFWDGSVEFCDAECFGSKQIDTAKTPQFHLPCFEDQLVKGLQSSLQILKRFEIPLPLRACLAIVGAKGYGTITSRSLLSEAQIIDRNELFFEPAMIDDWDVDLGQALRPIFDQIWNACGYMCSYSYQNNGEWKPNVR